ncbi:MAG: hypothetical protein KJ626_16885 [Verrucomicrobia bacterium]|nr:hypothetical protein [Verrucomicrobiota bacterium]
MKGLTGRARQARFAKAGIVLLCIFLGCWFAQVAFVSAQDDIDLEALLGDIAEDDALVGESDGTVEEVVVPTEEAVDEPLDAIIEDVVIEPVEEMGDEAVVEDTIVEEPMSVAEDAVEEADIEELTPFAEQTDLEAPEEVEVVEESLDFPEEAEVLEIMERAAEELVGDDIEEMPAEETVIDEVVVAPADVTIEPEIAEEKPAVDAEVVASFAHQEEVRRQAAEIEALKGIEQGYQQLMAKEFDSSIKSFVAALEILPERPQTDQDRQRAQWGLAEGRFRLAQNIYDHNGDLDEAERFVVESLKVSPDHRSAAKLLKKIGRAKERQKRLAGKQIPIKKLPHLVEIRENVEDLLSKGRAFFEIDDYNRAEVLFESVLAIDEYNVEAMRFLKKIEELKFKVSTYGRDATVADMIEDVRDAWNPPVREEVELPAELRSGTAAPSETPAQRLQQKMREITIPSIEFRSANIQDVVSFLVDASVAQDTEGVGVNVILNLNLPSGAVSSPPSGGDLGQASPWGADTADEFGSLFEEESAGGDVGGGGFSSIPTITLNLRRITLIDAIKYITEVANLKYRIEDNAVIITPAGVVSGRVVTRLYPVQPSILDVIVEKGEEQDRGGEFIEMGATTTFKRQDVKEFFQRAGVPFPVGTSITYNSAISQLIVANTPENLEVFERILSQLNVVPHQVEIEARFVEVKQSDLEEMGFQWILTDNWELAQRQGTGGAGSAERLQVNADANGFTKGNRFFNIDTGTGAISPASAISAGVNSTALGGLMSISSILTNPELNLIIHALDQSGNSDVLSAPRVTTRSGVNATIEVVQEIIYPTEFEVTEPTISASTSIVTTDGGATGGGLVTPPTVTPGSFETRQVGVILNVTPTVGPDGYTIDLTLAPEVAELIGWLQYGSSITAGGQSFTYNIPQPIFESRNVTTSIVIWDGQTVVMGGLMRETVVTVDDKIPILGDIPLLGRLFRTEGEKSEKSNLLIFVTARLVDPAGHPIHKTDELVLPGTSAALESDAQ